MPGVLQTASRQFGGLENPMSTAQVVGLQGAIFIISKKECSRVTRIWDECSRSIDLDSLDFSNEALTKFNLTICCAGFRILCALN